MSDLQCAATLIVARHGETEYESDLLSDDGGSLTLRGRDQARGLAESVRDRRISAVYSSSLARAVQTAEITAGQLGLGVGVREGLHEFRVGSFGGMPEDPNPFAEVFAAWRSGDLDASYPGGQSAREVIERMKDVLESISDLHRGETVLVVSHGGVMTLALPALAMNMRGDDAVGTTIANCSYAELRVDDDGWVCDAWPQ